MIPLEISRATRASSREVVSKVARAGARIYEVPISYAGRTYAEGKKINWKDGVQALYVILRNGL